MISLYSVLKPIHLTTVVFTGFLFILRGIWLFTGASPGFSKWVRVVPHVNDTLLLLSGLGLVFLTHQYPGEQRWLTIKLVGLVLYIALGMAAFRYIPVQRFRIIAWLVAIFVFTLIVATALTRGAIFHLI